MPLTRRTPRFAELATITEALLRGDGLDVPASAVDELVNARVESVARVLGVSPRAALVHAPDTLPHTLHADVRAALPLAGLRVAPD